MKTVLVVEDERMTQRTYQAGLRGLMDWRVVVVEHGMAALRTLEETPVQVLVTDLEMPHLPGHALIQAVTTWYPGIPILVVSGVQDSSSLDSALQSGALRIHPKPIRLSWLMDEIRGLGDRPPHGRAEGIPLASMLQMLQWERSECTLTVQSGELLGRLYVKDGELIQASCRAVRGMEGAMAILDFPHPKVEFVRHCRVDRAIHLPIAELLMEHSLRKDQAGGAPDPDQDRWGKA